MIGLKTLSLVDNRLRAIFPASSHLPFGGLNILLCGDFFQLPPVGAKPLYAVQGVGADTINGQQLYRAFDRTLRLTEVMRQVGEDEVAVKFRVALNELRESKLSRESWELLCKRIRNELSPDEVASFDTALRLYFTNAEVNGRNHDCLARGGQPVKKSPPTTLVGKHPRPQRRRQTTYPPSSI